MNTDDLNERCDNEYCGICGPPRVADHVVIPEWALYEDFKNPFLPPVLQMPTTPVYKVPPWEDDE